MYINRVENQNHKKGVAGSSGNAERQGKVKGHCFMLYLSHAFVCIVYYLYLGNNNVFISLTEGWKIILFMSFPGN